MENDKHTKLSEIIVTENEINKTEPNNCHWKWKIGKLSPFLSSFSSLSPYVWLPTCIGWRFTQPSHTRCNVIQITASQMKLTLASFVGLQQTGPALCRTASRWSVPVSLFRLTAPFQNSVTMLCVRCTFISLSLELSGLDGLWEPQALEEWPFPSRNYISHTFPFHNDARLVRV